MIDHINNGESGLSVRHKLNDAIDGVNEYKGRAFLDDAPKDGQLWGRRNGGWDTAGEVPKGTVEGSIAAWHTNSDAYREVKNITVDIDGNMTLNGELVALGYTPAVWNEAHGWGDHADAGYLLDAPADGSQYARKDGEWSVVEAVGDMVTSFNGRTGAVNPAYGDYSAPLVPIEVINGIAATDVQGALAEIQGEIDLARSSLMFKGTLAADAPDPAFSGATGEYYIFDTEGVRPAGSVTEGVAVSPGDWYVHALDGEQWQVIIYGAETPAVAVEYDPANNPLTNATDVQNALTDVGVAANAKLDDAPSDGSQYARKDAAWEPIAEYVETDPVFTASAAYGIQSSDITAWDNTALTVSTKETAWDDAYSWGNHSAAGYAMAFNSVLTGTTAMDAATIGGVAVVTDAPDADQQYARRLGSWEPIQAGAETDPVFKASPAYNITSAHITLLNGATNSSTGNTLVRRDQFGNFSANTITAALNGNAATATTATTATTVTNGVYTTGDQTIGGTKTFSNPIAGSITGNAATATTAAACTGNAATVTNGVYTTGNQTIGGVKTFSSTITGNISGNAGYATTAGSASSATTATNCSRSVSAGNGLTGGGQLNGNIALSMSGSFTGEFYVTGGVNAGSVNGDSGLIGGNNIASTGVVFVTTLGMSNNIIWNLAPGTGASHAANVSQLAFMVYGMAEMLEPVTGKNPDEVIRELLAKMNVEDIDDQLAHCKQLMGVA